MKALVWEGPRIMNMREAAEPQPAADEIVLHVAYAGICGSELSGYLGHNALRKPPLIMGHEFAGEIVALGENAQAINPQLKNGARVTVNPFQVLWRVCVLPARAESIVPQTRVDRGASSRCIRGICECACQIGAAAPRRDVAGNGRADRAGCGGRANG